MGNDLKEMLKKIQEDPNIATALAVMVAEHAAFKERLLELDEINDEIPSRWTANDLHATMKACGITDYKIKLIQSGPEFVESVLDANPFEPDKAVRIMLDPRPTERGTIKWTEVAGTAIFVGVLPVREVPSVGGVPFDRLPPPIKINPPMILGPTPLTNAYDVIINAAPAVIYGITR